MKKAILFPLLFIYTIIFAQDSKLEKIAATISAEGRELYKSEMASWYGTDIFLEKFGNKRDRIGGYFSYVVGNVPKCIFYSKGDTAKVLGTVIFDSTYNTTAAIADGIERDFTAAEKEYYTIRSRALVKANTDTLIKVYKNTDLNLIPLITNEEKKVYMLTGPKNDGVVIFGNDYLVTFDKNNEVKEIKKLHRNIVFINTKSSPGDTLKVTGSMHTHLAETGEYITPTDICTLMLYEKYTPWEQHIVVSEKYISMWICKTNRLLILTKDAWDKMQKSSK